MSSKSVISFYFERLVFIQKPSNLILRTHPTLIMRLLYDRTFATCRFALLTLRQNAGKRLVSRVSSSENGAQPNGMTTYSFIKSWPTNIWNGFPK